MKYILLVVYLLLSSSGLLFIKSGTSNLAVTLGPADLSMQLGYHLLIGFVLYVTSFLLSLWLMKQFALSYLYPIGVGVGNLIICLSSVLIFKEHITGLSWIGILFVCIGAVCINLGRGQ
jgi:multidrug transporter EmrE-like cation transporter